MSADRAVVEALHAGCSAVADMLLLARAQATRPNASMMSALRAQCIASAAEKAAGVLLESEELVSSTAASPHLWPHVARVIAMHIGFASARLVAVEGEVPALQPRVGSAGTSDGEEEHVEGTLESLLARCKATLTACEAAAAASAAPPSVGSTGVGPDTHRAPPLAAAALLESAPASGVEVTQNGAATAATAGLNLEARLRRVELALLCEEEPALVGGVDDAARVVAAAPLASQAHPPSCDAVPLPPLGVESERDDSSSASPLPQLGTARAHAETGSCPASPIEHEQACDTLQDFSAHQPQEQPQEQRHGAEIDWSFARVHFLAEAAILDAHALQRRVGERGVRVAHECSPTLASRAPVCVRALRALELQLEHAECATSSSPLRGARTVPR